MKLRVVTVFPSKRNFVPKFSLCWSLKWYWWKDDNIWEFQRTITIGIRLCFNRSTSRSMISTGSITRFRFVIGLDSFQWNHKWLIWKSFLEVWNMWNMFMQYCYSLTGLKSEGYWLTLSEILNGPVYIEFNFPDFLNGIMPFLGRTFNTTLPPTWNSKGLQLIDL